MIDALFSFLDRAPKGVLSTRRVPLRVSVQLHRVKNIVRSINNNEKTCSGFGSITQVMALRPGLAELTTQARRHAPMSSELPDRFSSGRFMRDA